MSKKDPRILLDARVWRVAAVASLFATGAIAQSANPWETPEYFRSGALAQVNTAAAYGLGLTGQGVLVGVVDSGLDTSHPEFAGRTAYGYDFRNNIPIGPDEDHDIDPTSHGTHVTGIIAAARNGIEMQGVAFNSTVVPTVYDASSSNQDNFFWQNWRYLASLGVPIINNSIGNNNCGPSSAPPCNVGDYTRAQAEALFPQTIAAMKATAEAGVLMVFATGNEVQPNPDVLGGMPYLIPELQRNFLAVMSVDANNVIAWYSNKCGVAKQWCLAAPGSDIYSTVSVGSGTGAYDGYATKSGTSMATPVVSGIAALVKEAFPWFTAYDLQQTLLTTATDIGEAGVDDVYGWGLANAGKAVLGYGMFTDTVTVDTKGYTSTFANDISGDGDLIKAGAGTLILSGTDTYSGNTYVLGGTLSINGSIISDVAVGEEGTLRGTGLISAPVAVAGRLAPGNSPGTLTVAGPVTLLSTATFQADIDGTGTSTGAGNYSRLVTTGATGTVQVAGTLAPVLRGITGDATNTYSPTLGSSYTIIQTSAGLAGSFASLTQPTDGLAPATRFDALYSAQSLALVVTPLSYSNLAANGLFTSANASAVGGALDSIRPTAGVALTGATGGLFTGLYTLSPGALPSALGQLTGEAYASTPTMVFDDARQVRTAISARLDDATAAQPDRNAAQLSQSLNVAVWATGYGGWGDASGSGVSSFDWTRSGFIAGADAKVSDSTRLGLAAGFGQSSGSLDALNSSVDNSHTDIAAYGVTQLAGFIAKYGAAYSWNSLTTSRTVAFGSFANGLDSSYDGSTTQVFGEVSRPFTFGTVQASPLLAVAYVKQNFDGFTEQGGAAALTGAASSMSTTLTTLGARFATDMALGSGTLTPSAKLGWQHAFGDVDADTVLWLSGSTPFAVAGAPIARDALALNLALAYGFTRDVSAGIAYDGVLAADAQSSTLKANLRVAF